ncbi:hypothetical protein [Roseivivax sp. THAF30]|jgi:hypothetical protein|uniref:hypothetical protein n=1 Tax=Roseivivax sp. THAF30 TaxID=2587852 RepID=UPI0012A91175|nr:hypothetical protein [Roseivivax sp. THAF30]QFT62154.1 hypothetical protein FIU91_04365 [Roseivivax sp. THAF30]
MRTRRLTAGLTVLFIAALLIFDQAQSEPVNRFQQPATIALGSGQAAGGAHCAALPE